MTPQDRAIAIQELEDLGRLFDLVERICTELDGRDLARPVHLLEAQAVRGALSSSDALIRSATRRAGEDSRLPAEMRFFSARRNRAVHEYGGFDWAILVRTVRIDFPGFRRQIEATLQSWIPLDSK